MLVVSRTYIAINILRYLAAHEGALVSSTILAQKISVPRPYTRKVANQLIRAGMVKSVRGTRGGLTLARPAGDIRVGDVPKVIETTRVGRGADHELLSHVLDEARQKFVEVLNEHSIADFRGWPGGGRETKPKARTAAAAISA